MTSLPISDASLAAALASSPVLMLCRMFVTNYRTAAVVFMSFYSMSLSVCVVLSVVFLASFCAISIAWHTVLKSGVCRSFNYKDQHALGDSLHEVC
jgi:hypothetical protein